MQLLYAEQRITSYFKNYNWFNVT